MAKRKPKKKKKLADKKPEKSLTRPIRKTGGRSNSGRVSVRHKGGAVKRLYRIIGLPKKPPFKAKVEAIEYDPNRTSHIALIVLDSGEKAYVIAPENMKEGDEIEVGDEAEVEPGNRMRLKNVPIGTEVFNIELEPGQGGKVARAAGAACTVLAQEGKYTHIKMPSGEIRKILKNCFATIGQASNREHRFEDTGKAGKSRRKGKRPHVRGSAMSPYAHPHGGGEGRTGVGLKHPKTPWGKPAHGVKTRKKKWTDKLIIKRRKKKKKKKK